MVKKVAFCFFKSRCHVWSTNQGGDIALHRASITFIANVKQQSVTTNLVKYLA